MTKEKSLDIYLEEIQDHINHGRLNEALLNVKEAIMNFPTHTKLHINCGNLQHYLGLLDDAEKSFKTNDFSNGRSYFLDGELVHSYYFF